MSDHLDDDRLNAPPTPTAHEIRHYIAELLEEIYKLSQDYRLDDITEMLGPLHTPRGTRQ